MVARLQSLGSSLTSARQMAADQAGQAFAAVQERYRLLERYYWNDQYEVVNGQIAALKASQGLYRNIRPIRNPFKRAVDWYPGNLFPGAMTPDGLPLPDGSPSCLGFADDTPEPVRLAMTQAMVWANWGQNRWDVGRNLAILGDQFGEIEVDYERAKVYPKFTHPGYVTNVEWNGSGDIVEYRLDIPQYDEDAKRGYLWGKVVTKETVTTLYDGKLHGYDNQPATIPNPWGFCPAAWCQFRNVGGQHGASLVDGVRQKIDELNSSLSSAHDFINKFANQGQVVFTDASMKDFLAGLNPDGGPTSDLPNPQSGRQTTKIFKFPKDSSIAPMIQNLGLADAVEYMRDLTKEIEADLPEATIGDRIRAFTTPPSGRSLSIMFNLEEKLLLETQGNADHMLTKLMQMSVTIGGHLANSGAWGSRSGLTEQQRRFLPFDIDSYDSGDLDATIVPRPLFAETPEERVAYAMSVEGLKTNTGRTIAGLSADTSAQLDAELAGVAQAGADRLTMAFNSGTGGIA